MVQINYDIYLKKTYEGDGLDIPFLFSIEHIEAFHNKNVDEIEGFKDLLFKYVDRSQMTIDKASLNYLKEEDWKENVDYLLKKEHIEILSKDLLYEMIFMYADENDGKLNGIGTFINESLNQLIKSFYEIAKSDLEYNDVDNICMNDVIHSLNWIFGETSTNPTPFFKENFNKPTSQWSFREVELRNMHKSKLFMIEIAKKKAEAKMMEEMKNKANKR